MMVMLRTSLIVSFLRHQLQLKLLEARLCDDVMVECSTRRLYQISSLIALIY